MWPLAVARGLQGRGWHWQGLFGLSCLLAPGISLPFSFSVQPSALPGLGQSLEGAVVSGRLCVPPAYPGAALVLVLVWHALRVWQGCLASSTG